MRLEHPWEEEWLRRQVESRARQGRRYGQIEENTFPTAPVGSRSVDFRDNGLFHDQTGVDLTGFAWTGTMMV